MDRQRLDSKGAAIAPSASWHTLARTARDRAILEFGGGKIPQVSKLYSDDQVKMALEELFHGKCAYCEQELGEQWDVEHYRPKGKVAEAPGHPGYFWLAYDWSNLYPSCTNCNQNRRDAPLWNDRRTLRAAGKFCQFPLADELKRVADPTADLGDERPLLLDPCATTDIPEKRFLFDAQGGIAAGPPVELPSLETEDPRAVATIGICNLNRRRLRKKRAKVIALVARLVRNLAEARIKDVPDSVVHEFEFMLAERVADEAPFAGTARYVRRHPENFAGLG